MFDTSGDEEVLIGRLFFDIYTRDGKLDGACEYSVRAPVNGKRLAEAILCANISSENACLSLMEVKDLLHELGHCVHCLVGRQRFAQFAGIGEPAGQKDFTEAPSEMLELWLEDPRSFAFAVNRQGESIPEDVLNRFLTAEKIGRGCFERSINLVKARYSVSGTPPHCEAPSGLNSVSNSSTCIHSL
jgi:Zn-dependent oligopeptidase